MTTILGEALKKKLEEKRKSECERTKLYYIEHKEERMEYSRKHHIEHREERRQYCIKWRNENQEYTKQYNEKYRKTHKEFIRKSRKRDKEKDREYRKQHSGQYLAHCHARRARKLNIEGGHFTESEWQKLLDATGHKCLCCGAEGVPLHRDHVIPLILGVAHTDEITNIQPLCGKCNSQKHTDSTDYRSEEALQNIAIALQNAQ